ADPQVSFDRMHLTPAGNQHVADELVAPVVEMAGVEPGAPKAPAARPPKTSMSYAAARPILDAHRDALPADLKRLPPAGLERAWPGWVSRHNADIRARLARGDEDSIVNLWLYGTTFTTLPRASKREISALHDRDAVEDLLIRRLDDLVAGLAAPGAN